MIDIDKACRFLVEKEQKEKNLRKIERDLVLSGLRSLAHLFEKYGITKAYLYGSFSDSSFHRFSDIDLAVVPEIEFTDLLKLFSEINRSFGYDVDLRTLSSLPFYPKVVREGIVIYERKN